jgi:hypothetical protein
MNVTEKQEMLRAIGKFIAEQIEAKTQPLVRKIAALEMEVVQLKSAKHDQPKQFRVITGRKST